MGCLDDAYYSVRVAVPGGPGRALRAEVSVLRSCAEIGTQGDAPVAPYRQVEVVDGKSFALGAIPAGSWGLYGRAWDESCALFAAGCETFTVSGSSSGTIGVALDAIEPVFCAGGCSEGRCSGEADGGRDADGGSDGSCGLPGCTDSGGSRECGAERPCASWPRDDFEDGEIGDLWYAWADEGCLSVEEGGAVSFVPPTVGQDRSFCAYSTAALYDLRGDTVTVEVPAVTAGTGRTFFTLSDERSTNLFLFLVTGQQLRFARPRGEDFEYLGGSVDYTAQEHRWWRFRESGGTTYFETSGDGREWTIRTTAPNPTALDAVFVQMGGGTIDPTDNQGTARFDNFNLPPP